jgi:uncharacterized protein
VTSDDATAVAAQTYVSLTTYRRTGAAVSTPVWVVGLEDGRLGFWTAAGTGKTRRLEHDARVVLRPCDVRGRVADGAPSYAGTAELVRSGGAFTEVQAKVLEKYGLMTTVTRVLHRFGPQGRAGLTYADTVVLVTLDAG